MRPRASPAAAFVVRWRGPMTSSQEVPGGIAADARRWLRGRRHLPGLRHALSAGERAYEWLRAASIRDDLPAIAGGRPVRLVPLPAARPYGRDERREIARAI